MSLDIRIGHDKQPAPVVPSNQPLYNLQTGKVLTDAGGTILVSEQDITLSSESVSSKATSVSFTDDGKTIKENDFKLSGENFFILNDSIRTIIIKDGGSGFTFDQNLLISSSGDGNAVIQLTHSPSTTSINGVAFVNGQSGSNYSSGTEIFINSPTGQPDDRAILEITEVGAIISGTNTKFTQQLSVNDTVVLPTGVLNGVVTDTSVPAIGSPGNSYNIGDIVTSTSGGIGLRVRIDAVVNGGIDQFTIVDRGSGYATGPVLLTLGSSGGTSQASINVIASSVPDYELRRVVSIADDSIAYLSLNVTNQKPLVSGVGVGSIFRKDIREIDPVFPIAEEFPLFSEVSSSILGVPKGETQLGLFSNVSSYGLDEDAFIFYSADSGRNEPSGWLRRNNRNFGSHYGSTYIENKEESAIVVASYPTSYTYPFPPGPSSLTPVDSEVHRRFCNFLKLGMVLYDYYKTTPSNPDVARGVGEAGFGSTSNGFALNFFPYVASFCSTDGNYILGNKDSRLVNREAPYYDEFNDVLISPFLINEDIYYANNVDQNGDPVPGATPIGKVRSYGLWDGTIHFDRDIGFIWSKWKEDFPSAPGDGFYIVGASSGSQVFVTGDMQFKSPGLMYYNMVSPRNTAYQTIQDIYNQIDTLEQSWKSIIRGDLINPEGGNVDITEVENLPDVARYIIGDEYGQGLAEGLRPFNDSLPGHSGAPDTRAYLVSKKAFRYQPCRISGYTYGVRASGDLTTTAVALEWGIGNDTDELMFQIKGANISLVRRSVVPLSDSVMERNLLDPGNAAFKTFRESGYASFLTDETTTVQEKINAISPYFDGDQVIKSLDSRNTNEFTGLLDKPVFETVIPRDQWNGDPLNGNGPSGWNLDVEKVTMYKIEFGWYGAIGVRFYVYVPVDNNEARWVAIHTLVIENSIGRPSMGDPYYKFKYSVINSGPSAVESPQYIYKYGTSCYIDGGDDGTITVNSVTSEPKVAPQETGGIPNSVTVVGLQPKTVIYNSLGKAIKNKQSVFPRQISLTSNGLTEISLVKCKACPGFSHTYQPNISAGYVGDERYLELVQTGVGSDGDPVYAFGTFNTGNPTGNISARMETKGLNRTINTTTNSTTVQVTGFANIDGEDDPSEPFAGGNIMRFLRVGDLVDFNKSIWTDAIRGTSEVYITSIDTDNNTFEVNIPAPSSFTGFGVKIQPLMFFELDYNAKIISPSLYLTYVDIPFPNAIPAGTPAYQSKITIDGNTLIDAIGLRTIELWTVNETLTASSTDKVFEALQYKIPRPIQPFIRVGNQEVRKNTHRWPARFSQYKSIAASTLPVFGSDNRMLALVPRGGNSNDGGSFSSGQRADFRIGITSFRPTQANVGQPIVWERPGTGEVISQEDFTEQYKLYAERFSEGIQNDAEGFEVGEYGLSRVPPFTVDYRIPDPPGTNTGRCSYVRITVDDPIPNSATQIPGSDISGVVNNVNGENLSISDLFALVNSTFDPTAFYLRFTGAAPLQFNAQGAEIGYNPDDPDQSEAVDPTDPAVIPKIGSGIRYASDFVQYTDAQNNLFNVVKLAGTNKFNGLNGRLVNNPSATTVYVYNTPVNLESYRRLSTKSFDYNPFPLYFFYEFRDNCRINGSTILERSQVDNTYNPGWIGSPSVTISNSNIEVGEIGRTGFTTGDFDSTPPNFTSENRLSSALIDKQSTAQLRPYEVIDRFYVGGNVGIPGDPSDDQFQTKSLDLSMIFGQQRETITPDLLNTTAYFFIASSKEEGTSTVVSGTLNYIEQQ
jgi:hypothetical protein